MLINYTIDAFNTLTQLVNFIEDKNTIGAGNRWLDKYEAFIQSKLQHPDKISFCNNLTFNSLNLRCLNFNDWVIAFSLHSDYILIEALLHKSRVTD